MRYLPMALIALSLLVSSLVAASERAQRYHELQSQAYLLCANALMYFEAQGGPPDPGHLAAYQGALSRLDGLTRQLGQPPELSQPLDEISALLSELEQLPRSEAPLYPARLIALLGAHEQLESRAAQHYRQLEPEVPARVRLLHRQSQALGRLLLQAQARSARVLGVYSVALSAAEFAAMDEGINQGFASLLAELPEHAERLQKQQRSFRFVRGQLLSSDFGKSIASAEPYVARSMLELDQLAAQRR
ncbi:hypothetical protein [Pseudomonas sp. 2FG]|uniref:hypothetical protein n=1 Tax=Pseudomonas sp. 2FG TaxID=2502191 RepID=UPI0010F480AF|nr:hypothetical protein [Pseudomonas sp. 2FG]